MAGTKVLAMTDIMSVIEFWYEICSDICRIC